MDHLPPHNPRATGQGCQGPNRVGSQQCLNQVLPEKWGPGGKFLAFRYGTDPRQLGIHPQTPKKASAGSYWRGLLRGASWEGGISVCLW